MALNSHPLYLYFYIIVDSILCNHPKLAVFLFKNQTPTFV